MKRSAATAIVVIMVLQLFGAGIMVNGLNDVTDFNMVPYGDTAMAGAKPPELAGWDWKFEDWTKSTLEGYGASDWVWWHVKLTNMDAGTYKFVVNHDNYDSGIDAFGFVEISNVRLLYGDYPNINDTGISVTVDDPWYYYDSNTRLMEFNSTFTTTESGSYYLRWDARLDPNETTAWPGKALHTHFKEYYYNGTYTGGGNQDIQVEQPLSPPFSVISGYKWYDADGDGTWDTDESALSDWTIHLTGTDTYGKIVDRFQVTDSSGFYRFAGIVKGNYTVHEELKTGWACTNQAGSPPKTSLIQITADNTNITGVNFGNRPIPPEIQVTKTADVTKGDVGDTVTYTVVVTNIGPSTLYDVSVYDDVKGHAYDKYIETGSGELEPNATWAFTYSHVLGTGDADPLVNTVTASGYDSYGVEASDEDSVTVDILRTAVSISKTGPASAEVGETVTYTITVTNTGGTDLYISSLVDTLLGNLTTEITGGVITTVEGSETFTYTRIVLDADQDPLLNAITVTGENSNEEDEVTATDGHSVDTGHAGVSISKTGPSTAKVGDTITYSITVTNTGDVDLYVTSIADTLLGNLTDKISGGVITTAEGSETFTYTYTVTTSDPDPLTNNITVTGENENGEDVVSDSDDHSVNIQRTGVSVTKTGPSTAEVWQIITYTITVTNTGETNLYITYLKDSILGNLKTHISGGVITVAEGSETFNYTYIVTASPDPLTNTVTVRGKNSNLGDEVTDTDSHTVDILKTGVEIEKTGPRRAQVGETITYTITVRNTGEVDLYINSITDTILGDLTGEISDGILTLAEGNETFTYNYTVTGTRDPLANAVNVNCENQYGSDWLSDSDGCSVDVMYTGVAIEKTGPSSAAVGEEITYVIEVTNTGEVDLYVTDITDTLLGNLTGEIGGGVITVAEGSETFTYSYVVQPGDPDPLPNTITVTGENRFGGDEVTDTDRSSTDLRDTGVSVDKTGPSSAAIGDEVTYTITVYNTGEVDLYVTEIYDTLLGDLTGEISGGVITVAEVYEEFEYTYVVQASDPDPLPNTITVTGENEYGGNEVTDSDGHSIDIEYTGVTIEKSGPSTAEVWEVITYTITVTNTGDTDLYISSLTDTLLGDLRSQISGGVITVAEGSETFDYTYRVTSTPDPLVNSITVVGENGNGEDEVTDTDDHRVDILYTGLEVNKSGPARAQVGETITYTVTVTNTGEVDLYVRSITDTLLGDITAYIADGDITLAEGFETFTYNFTVTDAYDPLTNGVNVNCENQYGSDWTSASDSHSVDVMYAALSVEKSGPATAEVGETLTYQIDLDNDGEVDLYITDINDTLLGNLTGMISGGVITVAEGSETIYCDYTVTDTFDPLENTVVVTAWNEYGDDEVSDSASHSVDVLRTGVSITKTGPATAVVGETIVYTITVTNTGEVDLYIDDLWDSLMGDLSGEISGGVVTISEGSETFTYEYTISGEDPDPLTNMMIVNGSNSHESDEVSDSDGHSVDIEYTDISIEKVGPGSAMVGETITYTITVYNDGDVDLYVTYLYDTLMGDLSGMISGGVITVGEGSETFTYNYTVTGEDSDPLVNNVTVVATNVNESDRDTDSDEHNVDILYTGVEILKTGPETAQIGETIEYTITVTNTGEVDLYIADLTDTLLGNLTSMITDGVITVEEGSETFTYYYTVTGEDGDPLDNVATVHGENEHGGDEVSSSDRHSVDVVHTGVSIEKAGPATAEVGDTITYTITVTNEGEVDLYITDLTDTLLGNLTTLITGGVITVEEGFETLEYDHTVTGEDDDPLVNTVTVTGENAYGEDEVSDSDTHRVDIMYTGVSIEKTGPRTAEVGETITYTITVTNTGDVDLYIAELNDSLLGDLSSHISGGVVTVEEGSETFTYNYTVGPNDPDLLWNNVSVEATNENQMDPVEDVDGHSVDLLYTGVLIEKAGPSSAEVGETITYTVTVINTGEVDLYITYLNDTLAGDLSGYISGGVVTVAEYYETFTYGYTVDALPDPLPNIVSVLATNGYGGDEVGDMSSHFVDILRTNVSIEKRGPETAEVGETITYTVTVHNDGEVDLWIAYLYDSLAGDISSQITGGVITVAEGYETVTYEYTVTSEDSDPLVNNVTVVGYNSHGRDWVVAQANHSVDLLYTGVEIVKTGP
ncbi:MAG: hypothetical protein L0Z54_03390, partial [Thermoplasmata archaeon]|nr:hypothetical protein [Thermoplasmata archaeon]